MLCKEMVALFKKKFLASDISHHASFESRNCLFLVFFSKYFFFVFNSHTKFYCCHSIERQVTTCLLAH